MDFSYSPKVEALRQQLLAFFDQHIYPNEARFHAEIGHNTATGQRWTPTRLIEELKPKARAAGLWNLFLPDSTLGAGLSNHEYAPLAEIMGRVLWASEVFNCSAPDTGNIEVLERYGTAAHKERWLTPLLAGEMRSAFAMTEPDVASSDAINIALTITRDDDGYRLNGRKWWISGAGDPRCQLYIVVGLSNPDQPRHGRHSLVLVPADAPGLRVGRALPVFGFDDAPHGHNEVDFDHVFVPAENLLIGEGRGFELLQGRLGPGRIHHCMRLIGLAERALELTCKRLSSRVAFGRELSQQGVWHERIAEARCAIDQARLLTLNAAWMMDRAGNKAAQREIAMIKIVAPNMAAKVVDMAIQAHGGAGVTDITPLAGFYMSARALRLADGPDEVHRAALAKLELARHAMPAA